MAGMLRNRSRPTALAVDMAAALTGQLHACPSCGAEKGSAPYQKPPRCDCDNAPPMYPLWDVRDSRARICGYVAGANHDDALESARQSPQFDRLQSFTVTPRLAERRHA